MAKAEGKKRIVVKVGTSTLTHKTGKTNIARLAKLASVLSDLKNEGHEIRKPFRACRLLRQWGSVSLCFFMISFSRNIRLR